MKLLYIITRAEAGGAQSHVADLICHFSKSNQVLLVSGEKGFLTEYAVNIGVPVKVVSSLVREVSIYKDYKTLQEICTIIDEFNPDLIHLHSTKAGLLGRVAAFIMRTPVVFTAHGWAFTIGVSFKRKLMAIPIEFFLALLGGKIINVSNFDLKLARNFFVGKKNQHYIVHNSVQDLPVKSKVESEHINIVMVARFNEQKAQDLLIRSLILLDENIRVTFIGDGHLQYGCKKLAHDLGISHRVIFLGSSNNVAELLPNYDVFALISHYEGFPISILEAMRASLPVISSDVGGVSESVINEVNGFTVENNINSISHAINAICSDRALLTRMGHNSRKIYEESFQLEPMLCKIEKIYSDIAN